MSLDVPAGSVTALVSRNGSGKSTTLRMLLVSPPPPPGPLSSTGFLTPSYQLPPWSSAQPSPVYPGTAP
ncbi:ATP-binding cassette domain-containing protein [Streptomyces xanthochromogenes]